MSPRPCISIKRSGFCFLCMRNVFSGIVIKGEGGLPHVAVPRSAAHQRGSSRHAHVHASVSVSELLTRAPLNEQSWPMHMHTLRPVR